MSENVLTKMVSDYKELTAMIDELKQEAESIADEIKAEMISRNTDEIRADIYKVRYKTITSTRFDSKSFKTVSARLGHSQTSTTLNIYAHALKSLDETASTALEDILQAK